MKKQTKTMTSTIRACLLIFFYTWSIGIFVVLKTKLKAESIKELVYWFIGSIIGFLILMVHLYVQSSWKLAGSGQFWLVLCEKRASFMQKSGRLSLVLSIQLHIQSDYPNRTGLTSGSSALGLNQLVPSRFFKYGYFWISLRFKQD